MVPAAAHGAAPGAAAQFGAVAEAALHARALAVGYRHADGRMLLAPPPGDLVIWGEGDELVVILDEGA
jgi:hypothetical protein